VDTDEVLKAELAKAIAECEYLREENARLKLRVGEAPDHDPRPEQFTKNPSVQTFAA
jgi:regulator of replication initiation timing